MTKRFVSAFGAIALALAAVIWAAAAARPEPAKTDGKTARLGNSEARISSGRAEVFSPAGERLYAVDGGFEYLTPLGENAAAAWSYGGRAVFLGAGGYRDFGAAGALGVFGAEGLAAVISADGSGARVSVYSAAGEVCSLSPEGLFPVAAAFSPDGRELALLCAGEGYSLCRYSLPSFEQLLSTNLDAPAYTLSWTEELSAVPLTGTPPP